MSWVIEAAKPKPVTFTGPITVRVQSEGTAFDALEVLEQAFAALPSNIKIVKTDFVTI